MKILFLLLSLFIVLSVRAQVQFGLFAGPQTTGVRYLINDDKQESDLKTGINLGAQFKIPFENKLSFAPAIMYNLRGYKVQFNATSFPPDSAAINNNTSFHTIELAFLLQHDFNLDPGHAFIRFGPSLDFALLGNEKYNTANSAVDRNMKFGFGDYGHYLASAIVQLGYECTNGVFFFGHYNYGLTSMNNADHGPEIGNRAAGISIGKYFNRKKIVMDTKNKQ
ncbi:MAG TPA: porin family protein [Chitinophagaceae bacterium]|nr:porin family protein [Chitinophagaceae bacterium]